MLDFILDWVYTDFRWLELWITYNLQQRNKLYLNSGYLTNKLTKTNMFITKPMRSASKSVALLTLERKYRLLEAKEHRLLKAGRIEDAIAIQTVKAITFRLISQNK